MMEGDGTKEGKNFESFKKAGEKNTMRYGSRVA